jgi:hypothetical protein
VQDAAQTSAIDTAQTAGGGEYAITDGFPSNTYGLWYETPDEN